MEVKEITIRKVMPDDCKDICRLSIQLGYTYPLEKTRDRIRYILDKTNDEVFVAVYDSMIIGYIHVSAYNLMYNDPLVNVLGFVVEEKYRNKGVGKRLLKAAEEYAKDSGYSGVRLTSGMDRKDAHAFYEKCGYVNRKDQKNYIKSF